MPKKIHSFALRVSASAFVEVHSCCIALTQIMDVAESLLGHIDPKHFNMHSRHRKGQSR